MNIIDGKYKYEYFREQIFNPSLETFTNLFLILDQTFQNQQFPPEVLHKHENNHLEPAIMGT